MVKAQQRLLICKLLLDSAKLARAESGAAFGRGIEQYFVALALTIGHIEGRAFTASKLAHFLDMPRMTALRHLTALSKRGWVLRRGNAYYLNEVSANRDSVLGMFARIEIMIRHTARRLSETL